MRRQRIPESRKLTRSQVTTLALAVALLASPGASSAREFIWIGNPGQPTVPFDPTLGAIKVAVALCGLDSVTEVPAVCSQRYI